MTTEKIEESQYIRNYPIQSFDPEELKKGGIVKLKGENLYSIWVKTNCCNLTSDQLRKLADITDRYAKGFLLFTTRQIPIIPFVHLDDISIVKEELRKIELELDRCGPRVRNINVCIGNRSCSNSVIDPISLAELLNNFFRDPILHKIKIGVSGCSKDCIISRVLNDISFIAEMNEGRRGFDAYIGGRLGVNPFIGVKIASLLSEKECVNLTRNYFSLLRGEGRKGERCADIIGRLGLERIRNELTRDLQNEISIEPIKCKMGMSDWKNGCETVKIRAICGEVSSVQLRNIANLADKFGDGIVHFPIRGSPELLGIRKGSIDALEGEFEKSSLRKIDGGLNNLQSCFGNYCTESLVDPQTLLRRIEVFAENMNLKGLDVTISASGCPNSCGIPQLSDIGFYGSVKPKVNDLACNGCGLCVSVCKRNAISLENGVAKIADKDCRSCGQCIAICPLNAILEEKKGFTVLIGGRGGGEPRLGSRIAEYLSEDEAFQLAGKYLRLCEREGCGLNALIDKIGLEKTTEIAKKID